MIRSALVRFVVIATFVGAPRVVANAQWWTPEYDEQLQRQQQQQAEQQAAREYGAVVTGRPLTLPQLGVSIRGSAELVQRPYTLAGQPETRELAFGMTAGAAIGATDDIEVGLEAADATFTPELDFNDLSVYALFRFVDRYYIQFGAELTLNIPLGSDDVAIPSDPLGANNRFGGHVTGVIAVRVENTFRLDTGVRFNVDDHGLWFLSVPLRATVNIIPGLFVGLETIFHTDFYDVVFPVLLRAGMTFEHNGRPLADVEIVGGFPSGLVARDRRAPQFTTDVWGIGVRAQFLILPD